MNVLEYSNDQELARILKVSQTAIRKVWPAIAITAQAVELLHKSENWMLLVRDSNEQPVAVLRVSRSNRRSLSVVEAELRLIAAIIKNKPAQLSIIEPITGINGLACSAISHADDEYVVAMFRFHQGHRLAADSWATVLPKIGLQAALLQQAVTAADLPQLQRQHWNDKTILSNAPVWGNWRSHPQLIGQNLHQLQGLEDELRLRLTEAGRTNYQLLHADLRPDNILYSEHPPCYRILDFDDAAYSWRLFDLAASLSFCEHRSDLTSQIAAWLQGYQQVTTVTAAELRLLPWLLLLRRLQLLGWIATFADTTLAQAATSNNYVQHTLAMVRSGHPFFALLVAEHPPDSWLP